ncbi:aspartate kinase [Peptoniphilus catoniae]|uniref:aspartate kinase n=1 Tax=Peptoniphilus catoniae TaxID=1660341 RepID=UPI0010FF3A8C|nr:aspartate kinase [Peptoniphilus catoniae]
MSLIVSKFGGTSLASSQTFLKVSNIIKSDKARRYIVASAPGKTKSEDTKVTDLLYLTYDLAKHKINFNDILDKIINKYREIIEGCKLDMDLTDYFNSISKNLEEGASKEYIASRGEYLNALILSKLLDYDFIDAEELIFFDESGKFLEDKSYKAIAQMIKDHKCAVIPGFYGVDPKGNIKTFSRGGGDLTGSIISRGVSADLYENWTDVSGFLSADPRIVKNPRQINTITYSELRELSYAGASVLHEEAILPLADQGIKIQVKNTFSPEDKGTLIVADAETEDESEITGISGKKHFSVINIEKIQMKLDKSFYRKLMSVLEVNHIDLEHMPTSIDSISLIVKENQLASNYDTIINEIKTFCSPDKVSVEQNIALITVVGRAMKNNIGVAAKLFAALAEAKINIQMIIQGSSELNIIVGIKESDYEKAIRRIYDAFIVE